MGQRAATLGDVKRALRREAIVRRAAVANTGSVAASAVAAHFLRAVPIAPDAVISGYWPLADELDPRPLLEELAAAGHLLGLPVVVGRGRPLGFRAWAPGATLEQADFVISVPLDDAPRVNPDVLLVPLLAYDDEGYRLGYGGGYFDRTLTALRAAGSVLAVGLAYAAQRVAAVPHGSEDERLDWLVTETGAAPVEAG